jgi:hypothetical protein
MPSQPKIVSLALETRNGTQIPNSLSHVVPIPGAFMEQADQEKNRPNAKRRRVGPCNTYNCHGLTFGARRTGIPAHIDKILKEDGYTSVSSKDVLPGDIVIYFEADGGVRAEVSHSGIVLERTSLGAVKVLSKWGYGDEWIHFLADCPYNANNVEFYRINDCTGTSPR